MVGGDAVGVLALVSKYGATAVKSVYHALSSRRSASRIRTEALEILGVTSDHNISFRSDNVHPAYDHGHRVGPDNAEALRALAGTALVAADARDKLLLASDVFASLADSHVLVGGPVAEGLTRIVFGYAPEQANPAQPSSARLTADILPASLPYGLMCDKELLSATAARYVRGVEGVVRQPNWYVSDSDGRPVRRPVTESTTGLLASDLLLITRVPNFLSLEGLDAGHFLLSIAGTHGIGTRSIDLVFRDEEVLRTLTVKLQSHPEAFQVLIEASSVKHHPAKGSVATRVRVLDVVTFPGDWREAQSRAARALVRWRHRDAQVAKQRGF